MFKHRNLVFSSIIIILLLAFGAYKYLTVRTNQPHYTPQQATQKFKPAFMMNREEGTKAAQATDPNRKQDPHYHAPKNQNQPTTTPLFPSQQQSDEIIQPIRQHFKSLTFNNAGAYIINNNNPDINTVKPNQKPWAKNHSKFLSGKPEEADAYLTRQARQYRNRQQTHNGITNWKPAGYHQRIHLPAPYQFAYNRGHLLGYAIVGNIKDFNASEANKHNIITQTMWANQANEPNNTGQNYYEGLVRQALDQNKSVRYKVIPWYASRFEKVPRAIQLEAKSSDNTLKFNVLVPNDQANINIDYYSGFTTPINQQ